MTLKVRSTARRVACALALSLAGFLLRVPDVRATVTGTTTQVSYVGDSVNRAFPVPFKFMSNSDLVVTVTSSSGASVPPGAYTVTGAGAASGTVTFSVAPGAGNVVLIDRNQALTQPTNFRSQGSFNPATYENAYDRDVLGVQQVNSDLSALSAKTAADISALEDYIFGLTAGNLVVLPKTWSFMGDGLTTVFTITGAEVSSAASYLVAVNGITQIPGADYTVSAGAAQLTFMGAPPPFGAAISVRSLTYAKAQAVNDTTTVTSTGSVTPRMLKDRFADVTNVLDFGADPSGTSDSSAAVQLAVSALAAKGGTVYFPPGTYRLASTINITSSTGRLALVGSGRASKILNGVVGNPAPPLFNFLAAGNFWQIQDLWIVGNGIAGTGGNGHALAFFCSLGASCGSSGYTPQEVSIERVIIQDHVGNGMDYAGASMPASAVYAYAGLGHKIANCNFQHNSMNVRWDKMFKARIVDTVLFGSSSADHLSYNGLNLTNSSAIAVTDSTITANGGTGAATDGNVYVGTSEAVSFKGVNFKNGLPYNLNLAGTNNINRQVVVYGSFFEQLDPLYGATAIAGGNGTDSLIIEANKFVWVNSITTAIGVSIVQNATSWNMLGLVIRGNSFSIGDGGTLDACIRINTTAIVHSPLIEANHCGRVDASGVASTISYGVDLQSGPIGAVIRGNSFWAALLVTMTNAVAIRAPGITSTVMQANTYGGAGTLTNKLALSGGGPTPMNIGDDVYTSPNFVMGQVGGNMHIGVTQLVFDAPTPTTNGIRTMYSSVPAGVRTPLTFDSVAASSSGNAIEVRDNGVLKFYVNPAAATLFAPQLLQGDSTGFKYEGVVTTSGSAIAIKAGNGTALTTAGDKIQCWYKDNLSTQQVCFDYLGTPVYPQACNSTGSPGNATCNQATGRASLAAAAAAVTITNSLVAATSRLFVTLQSADATCTFVKSVVPGAGSFVLTTNAACTGTTNFAWKVEN